MPHAHLTYLFRTLIFQLFLFALIWLEYIKKPHLDLLTIESHSINSRFTSPNILTVFSPNHSLRYLIDAFTFLNWYPYLCWVWNPMRKLPFWIFQRITTIWEPLFRTDSVMGINGHRFTLTALKNKIILDYFLW